jgi:quercetin dioxygenase-like cupin family protein
MREPEQLLIKAADLPTLQHTPGGFVRFLHGDEQGFGGISFIVSDNPPGGGAIAHRHPDKELFVLYEGRGKYTVEGRTVVAEAGDIVVIPANTWHSFVNDGDGPLRHVALYDTGHIDTELPPTS